MGTNPVASLAALLAECPFLYTVNDYGAVGPGEESAEAYGMKGGVAEWLLARGVQYAPREHEMVADHCMRCGMSGASISFAHPHENECRGAAPPRESGHCVHGFELRAEGCDLCLQDAFARAKREPLSPAEQLSELTADINRAALPGGVVNTRGVAEFLIARGWARGRPEGPSAPPEPEGGQV